ncbi:exopolysaccharide biosynthesis protein [Sphingomonas sp. NY01]|uniref:exopolysaccharide biosynthesis protein n=1 Tax=Sphingomonas sp. NY01 TaxID=2968057 RepID=UPI00315D6882
MASDPHSISDILDALDELADKQDRVSLGDVIEAFGNRSYGPFLLLPALVDISPVGSIPGLPTVLACVILLTAVQMVLGRKHLWLPGLLRNRSVKAETVRKTTKKARKPAGWADRWFHGRLPALTKGPFVRVAAVACILLACTVPPLELLPLATTAPMAAIATFGLALMVRDGLVMIVAIVLAGVAVAIGAGLLGSKIGG